MNSALGEASVSIEKVEAFLSASGGEGKYKAGDAWNGDWKDQTWLAKVDAANLLNDIFNSLSDARITFSKRVHSFYILKEILAADRSHVAELTGFVQELAALSRTGQTLT